MQNRRRHNCVLPFKNIFTYLSIYAFIVQKKKKKIFNWEFYRYVFIYSNNLDQILNLLTTEHWIKYIYEVHRKPNNIFFIFLLFLFTHWHVFFYFFPFILGEQQ